MIVASFLAYCVDWNRFDTPKIEYEDNQLAKMIESTIKKMEKILEAIQIDV